MEVHGIEWKNVLEFPPMKHEQWQENIVGLLPRKKSLLLMQTLFTAAIIKRL